MYPEAEVDLRLENIVARLTAEHCDALLLSSPDGILYATGFASPSLYDYGQIGAAWCVILASGDRHLFVSEFEYPAAQAACGPGTTLHSYPTWIHIDDFADASAERPIQPDLNEVATQAPRWLRARVRTGGRIAMELSRLPMPIHRAVHAVLGECEVIAADDLLKQIRAHKSTWEIDVLRRAAQYSERAMEQTAQQLVAGMTEADMVAIFDAACRAQGPDITGVGHAHTVGEAFVPSRFPSAYELKSGDIVRLDGGPKVHGYNSDLARTFVVGDEADPSRVRLYDALWDAYAWAQGEIAPGVSFARIFQGIEKRASAGLDIAYRRGHQGHSIGCSTFVEEWPFIAATEGEFEPGTVFSLEVPFYGSRTQSYNIEDSFVVTADGVEWFSRAKRGLQWHR